MSKKSKLIANEVPKPVDNKSIMEKISELPSDQRNEMLDKIVEKYCGGDETRLKYTWELWRRGNQWLPEHDEWRTCAFLAGRGFGKLVNPSIPLYTKEGWKSMGSVKINDEVLDETGNWCKITGAYDLEIPKKAYRLHFNDGTFIEAGGEHFWFTWSHQNRKQYLRYHKEKYGVSANDFPENWINYSPDKELNDKILDYYQKNGNVKGVSKVLGYRANPSTVKSVLEGNYVFGTKKDTNEIVETFWHSAREDANHCIPNVKPLNFPEAELPLHPRVLGYWLANGFTGGEQCAAHQDDIPVLIKEFELLGYSCSYFPEQDNQRFKIHGIKDSLKSLGIYYEKATPQIYLEASVKQRWELLQGFMTGDGGVDGASCVSYTSSRKNLADDVHWLIVSLGMKTYIDTRVPTYTYKGEKLEGKLSYRVNFVPTEQVFFLPRKADKLQFDRKQLLKRRHRMIVNYEEIEPYPMRCISVDSPNGAYCLGKELLVTSNTRVGGEIVRHMVENGLAKRVGIIAPTAHDTVAVVLYGESGVLNISPPWFMPKHHPTSKKVSWPNGAVAYLFSAEDPDSLRGHQFDFIWADELAAWTKGKRVWEQAIFTLRLGHKPKSVVTTTPRANELIKSIVGDPKTWTITGTTEENKANIDIEQMTSMFEGTRLGKQELLGQILEDVEGALWKQDWIDRNRVQLKDIHKLPEFLYIVLAIDPAMTTNKNSDETGICVAAYGVDDKYYILYADSHKDTPHEWAKRVFGLYDAFVVTSIIAETNQGGDMVLQNLTKLRPDISVHGIHAKKGKALRAEEVVHLYELGKVRHVGNFPKAESQMIEFNPLTNPDGSDDICLIGNTIIETANGRIPLKSVKENDLVLTRNGYKKVLNSSITGLDAMTYGVLISDGTILIGTESHPLFIENKGFTKIKNIEIGDLVYKCQKKRNPLLTQLNSTELLIEDTQNQKIQALDVTTIQAEALLKKDLEDYIEKFGNLFTEKSQKDMSFITKTGTILTTIFQILSVFQKKNILKNTQKNYQQGLQQPSLLSISEELETWLQNGIGRLKEESGTENTQKIITLERIKIINAFVSHAVQSLTQLETVFNSAQENVLKNTIEIQVNTLLKSNANFAELLLLISTHMENMQEDTVQRVVLGKSVLRKDTVYNLKIEDESEYFANGVLTHNCDALVYSVKALMEKAMVNAVYRPAVGGLRHKLLNYRAR